MKSFPPLFFFNDTATTEIYTLSLHDALPIYLSQNVLRSRAGAVLSAFEDVVIQDGSSFAVHDALARTFGGRFTKIDRKSTRLNSSHLVISYAVFCLKKKNRAEI